MSAARHRHSSRALMLDPANRFLLFLAHFDPGSNLPPRWVFPGGGFEKGEDALQCLVREVFEETGLQIAHDEVRQPFATIWHEMEDKRLYDTGEAHFFELKVSEQFSPSKEFWTLDEHRDNVSHRWWSFEEIIEERAWVGPDGAIELLQKRLGSGHF